MTTSLRLGLRFARGNRVLLSVRALLTAIGAAVAVLLVLAVLAVWRVGRVSQDRMVAQSPHLDPKGTLLYAAVDDRWHGADLKRIYVAAASRQVPTPPGLTSVPRSGEVALAPALADALDAGDGELRARFSGLRVLRIARAGLTNRAQYIAYVGARPEALRGSPRVAWFGDADQVTTLTSRLKVLSLLLFLGFVAVPFTAMCAVATRVSAASRRRRLAALWMIGVSPLQLRTAAAVESTVAVASGSATGIAAFQILRAWVATHVTVHGVRPFYEDLGLPVWIQSAVLGACVVVALISGALLSGAAGWRSARPGRAPRQYGPAPLLVLGLGVACGLVTAYRVTPSSRAFAGMIGLDLTAVALVSGAGLSLEPQSE